MFRKLTTVFATFALTVAALGISVGPAFAKSPDSNTKNDSSATTANVSTGQAISANVGRDGVVLPSSGYTGTLELNRSEAVKKDNMPNHSGDLRFVQTMINFNVEQGEANDAYTHGLNYVYFDLTHQQQSMWNSGEIAIYRFDTSTSTWVKMPTTYVNRGGYGRLATVATSFGTYGLAETIPQ